MSYHINGKTGLSKKEWKREGRNTLDRLTIYFAVPLLIALTWLSYRMQ